MNTWCLDTQIFQFLNFTAFHHFSFFSMNPQPIFTFPSKSSRADSSQNFKCLLIVSDLTSISSSIIHPTLNSHLLKLLPTLHLHQGQLQESLPRASQLWGFNMKIWISHHVLDGSTSNCCIIPMLLFATRSIHWLLQNPSITQWGDWGSAGLFI